jgi:hypothetical protein
MVPQKSQQQQKKKKKREREREKNPNRPFSNIIGRIHDPETKQVSLRWKSSVLRPINANADTICHIKGIIYNKLVPPKQMANQIFFLQV